MNFICEVIFRNRALTLKIRLAKFYVTLNEFLNKMDFILKILYIF